MSCLYSRHLWSVLYGFWQQTTGLLPTNVPFCYLHLNLHITWHTTIIFITLAHKDPTDIVVVDSNVDNSCTGQLTVSRNVNSFLPPYSNKSNHNHPAEISRYSQHRRRTNAACNNFEHCGSAVTSHQVCWATNPDVIHAGTPISHRWHQQGQPTKALSSPTSRNFKSS